MSVWGRNPGSRIRLRLLACGQGSQEIAPLLASGSLTGSLPAIARIREHPPACVMSWGTGDGAAGPVDEPQLQG